MTRLMYLQSGDPRQMLNERQQALSASKIKLEWITVFMDMLIFHIFICLR